MLLSLLSLLVSAAIVAFGIIESRKYLKPYQTSVATLKRFCQKLETCHEGVSFREVLSGWLKNEDATVHLLALRLHRLCNREPLMTRGRAVWVVDLDQLCDAKALFRNRLEFERIQTMPALLTGIGILFTFMGLSLGVMGLDPTNAAQLSSGVKQLLGGMSLAFMTSIAGVGTSLWWNSRQRHVRGDFEDEISALSQILLSKPYLIQPEELNDLLIMYQADQTKALQGMGETVADAVKRGMEAAGLHEIRQLLQEREKRGDHLSVLGKVLTDLKRQITLMSEGFQDMRNAQLQVAKSIQQGGSIGGNKPGTPQNLTQQQQRLFSDTQAALQQFGSLHHSQGELVQNIQSSAETLKKLMQAAQTATADIVSTHQSTTQQLQHLEKHWNQFNEQVKRMQDRLDQSLKYFENGLHQSLQKVHGQVDDVLAQSMSHFQKALEGMDQNLAALEVMFKTQDGPKKGSWLNRG